MVTTDDGRGEDAQPSVRPARTIDRRSVLLKAAAAGAIVWAAPAIISPDRAAAATCTPKCAPQEFGVTATASIDCPLGLFRRMLVTVTPTTPNCPCSAGTAATVCYSAPTSATGPTVVVIAAGPTANSFYIQQNTLTTPPTAGTYTAVGFRIAEGCADRLGNVTFRTCTYNISVAYNTTTACGGPLANATVASQGCTTSCANPGTLCPF